MKITHDIYTHTFQTLQVLDPSTSARNLISKAANLGHTVLGISNYMWDSSVPVNVRTLRGQPEKYVLEIKHAIPADTQGVRVLIGAECDYCGLSDTLAITKKTAKLFDYVIVRHSHIKSEGLVVAEDAHTIEVRNALKQKLIAEMPDISEELIARMVDAVKRKDAVAIAAPKYDYCAKMANFLHESLDSLIANPHLAEVAAETPTAVAQPLCPMGCTSDEMQRILDYLDLERAARQLSALAALGVGIVIDMSVFDTERAVDESNKAFKLARLAIEAGCRVMFGSNAYALSELDRMRKAEQLADRLGITEDKLSELVR